jgi:hypothetical protein
MHAEAFWHFDEWFLSKIRDARLRNPKGVVRVLGPKPIRFLRTHPVGRAILFGMKVGGAVGGFDLLVQRRAFVRACWE